MHCFAYITYADVTRSFSADCDAVGSRYGVSMDTSSHCRSVDDSKLLTKNRLMPSLGTPDSCENPSAVCMPASSEMTRPKTADTDVQRSNTTSLQTSASLQPLLTTRPDGSHQTP